MDTKIDWLSFTLPLKENPFRTIGTQWQFVLRTIQKCESLNSPFTEIKEGFEITPAHGFYKYCARHQANGIVIKWGDINDHVFIEFSGVGCEWLRSLGALDNLLALVSGRVSRIDIATDIETTTTPREFVALSYAPRIVSRSLVTSQTGDTEYVGSRTGERMARVYRYNPPHPRSAFLRVEIEYKGESAKELSRLIGLENLIIMSVSANAPFGWQHPIWNPNAIQISKIPSRKHDREGGATLLWLIEVVVPSMKRMEKEGYFNLREWVEDNLFGT